MMLAISDEKCRHTHHNTEPELAEPEWVGGSDPNIGVVTIVSITIMLKVAQGCNVFAEIDTEHHHKALPHVLK